MRIIYNEVPVSNGEGVNIPDSRVGDIQLVQRADSAYICWMEYRQAAGPILNVEGKA